MKRVVIDTVDYEGKRVIFTKRKLLQKTPTHPELNRSAFIKNVEKTIIKPEEVWQDYENKNKKRCYYKKYSPTTWVKVVVWIADNPRQVVTAFEVNRIKECDYANVAQLL